ncbi:hypothetical protein ACFX12_046290 [Malus domestica]
MCVNLRAPWQGRLAKMLNLYSHRENTPNRITFSKIEEAPLPESREPDSHQDCFLKNQRGTVIRISRARLPPGLLSQKSKRHCYPNLESQTPTMIAFSKSKRQHSPNLKSQIPNRIACSKTEEAPLFKLREPDFLG